MSLPLLATKLYIPKLRSEIVKRPRLTALLNAGLHRRLTLVSAPPGFGKTTLVSEWGDTCQRPVAWLSLDERDQDFSRFLVYLIAAIQTVVADFGAGLLGLLQSPQMPPSDVILTILINELSRVPEPFLLVLDDYHLLESKPVDQALAFLLDHLPPMLHLVLATREDPQLPLARLRARDQLTELRIADLRFSAAEAADFLKQSMKLNLSPEHIAALEARTEGWIAGLQLAAISVQGHADAGRFIASFTGSHRFIMDYLVEEVLLQQSDSVKQFLLQTSILPRISASLSDALLASATPGGGRILDYLDQANLLVVRLDDQRQWYRYHHLFADMLYARLLRDSPALVPVLHGRASLWFEQNQCLPDAIRHALAAQDSLRAADLLEWAWPEMDGRFQTKAWLAWVEQVPEPVIRCRPVLSTCYGWALLNEGLLEAGQVWLQYATDCLEQPESLEWVIVDQAQFQSLPGTLATARAFLAQALGDSEATLCFARQALAHLTEKDTIRRCVVKAIMGLTHWAQGELELAFQALSDSMGGFKQAGQIKFALSGTFGLADIRKTQGRLRAAVSVYEQALKLSAAQGEPPMPGTTDLYLGLGDLCREQGDFEAASRHLHRAEALGDAAGLPDWRYRWCLAQSRLALSQQDFAGALSLLDQAETLYFRTPVPNLKPVQAMRARVWIRQGSLGSAQDWAEQRRSALANDFSFLTEFEQITLARLGLAELSQAKHKAKPAHNFPQALTALLARLRQAAEAGGRNDSLIEICVLQALALQLQKNPVAASEVLEQALRRAEPEGYVRVFLDEGDAMASLLAQITGPMAGYAARLRGASVPPQQGGQLASQNAPLSEPLSQRELEVLMLIAQGLSNFEISERLFLALSSVKGHNRNIFGKLGVRRRTEAVARARELGLLQTNV